MRQLLRRAWHLLFQRQAGDDLAEEMAFHCAMKQREIEDRGVDPAEAAAAARRAFGSSALAGDMSRDVWVWTWLQDGLRDLRFATRLLVKERSFTAVAVLTLGLGIGVNNTLFIAVNTACLRGLPIERPDRVMFLSSRDARERQLGLSRREVDQTRRGLPSFSGLAGFANAQMSVGDEDRAPEREVGTYISSNGFHLLGEPPALGRDFLPADDQPGAPPVAIIAHGLWSRRYAGDPSIVGRTIRVNGKLAIVVGVMRDPFQFPGNTGVWLPLTQMPGPAAAPARTLSVFGRLIDSSTVAQARTEIDALSTRLSHDFPETNQGMRLAAVPINERYNQRVTDPSWLSFLALGVVVVLIACANVANLLLMRAMRRAHEMATRASLGATRGHLVRQLLVESALLAALGGVLGLVLAIAGARGLQRLIPPNTVPYWLTFTMDARTLLVLCGVCLGTVLVFGLAPALHVARADVNEVMKTGGRSGMAGLRERRWTTVFLVAEFGLTMMFVAALVVGLRGVVAARQADLVIHPANLITTWVTLPPDRYRTEAQRLDFYSHLDERVALVPGVSGTAFMTALPLGGAVPKQLAIDGRQTAPGTTPPTVFAITISPRAFDVLDVPLVAGRPFDERDGLPGNARVIVNQRFAQMFFPAVDPIGQRIALSDASASSPGLHLAAPTTPGAGGDPATVWLTIVGVSASVRQGPALIPDPIAYTPLRASPAATVAVVVRGAGEPAGLAPLLREAVRSIDADLPLYRVMSMEQALDNSQWAARGSIVISMVIVWIAIGLAAVGLYAVTAHSVVQRSQEIGVRMALGAGTRDIVRLVGRRVCVQVGLGTVAGIAFTLVWQKAFAEVPSGTASPTDPASLIGAAAVFAVVAVLASASPLRKATRVDPLVALRYE
jgi:putative ABC transport system permease protein